MHCQFHPESDGLLRAVLENDPAGHLVLLGGRDPYTLGRLQARFQRTLGASADRIIVLPPQQGDRFRRLLSVGDVLLDLPQYSVSLIAADAFSVDLPVVTLPGRLKVERYAQGYYRRMGVAGPVASSEDQYVELAVRLGTDRDYHDLLRRQISAGKHRLFEDHQVVRQHEEFFRDALARTFGNAAEKQVTTGQASPVATAIES